MRLGSSLLFLILTAGIAVLAVTGVDSDVEPADDVAIEDVDAWFV